MSREWEPVERKRSELSLFACVLAWGTVRERKRIKLSLLVRHQSKCCPSVGEKIVGDSEDDMAEGWGGRWSRDEHKRSELSLLARVRVVQAGLWSAKV